MDPSGIILTIDEGTTSTRVIAFDADFQPVAQSQSPLTLAYPQDGWVEQSASEIWDHTLKAMQSVITEVGGIDRITAIALSNQRETTVVWDRKSGEPIAPAIVWQDRRTHDHCEALIAAGHELKIEAITGLRLDPYFSGTKLAWILDNVDGARVRAEAGELAAGTIDSFLIWKLTGGQVHATDVTNASRTLLYGLDRTEDSGWDAWIADLLDIPLAMMPEVRASNAGFGETDASLFGQSVPIAAAIGDQQAALVGQGCFSSGDAKITFGTGAFLVANTGSSRPHSKNRLLATIGYQTDDGTSAYALEGSIFNSGTVVGWLKNDLGLIESAADTSAMAQSVPDNGGVYMVPAFTGLGAPHWDADARGVICGITRATQAAHIVRAGLEATAYQTRDLLKAFGADGVKVTCLRVDGGMAANDWLMQFLADICDCKVERPAYGEMTALGATVMAATALKWITLDEWRDREVELARFSPSISTQDRDHLCKGWDQAVRRTML